MQSVVHAHTHITGAIQFMSTDNDLVFGMNCGCLIDTKSFAFEYAKDFDTDQYWELVLCWIMVKSQCLFRWNCEIII